MRAGGSPRLRRLEDRHALARELVRVAVGGGDEHGPVGRRGRGGQEVVGLVARRLRGGEPERTRELRQQVELLEEVGVELAPALVARELLVAVRRRRRASPSRRPPRAGCSVSQSRSSIVREADERARRAALGAADRLRHPVVGAVRERVAVDREQRPVHSSASMRVDRLHQPVGGDLGRLVARRGPVRSSERDRGP